MGDRMTPIPFEKLLNWILHEYREEGTIFGIHKEKFFRSSNNIRVEVLGENIATCIGPAAGPHTQLAQNIISSYLTGSRFIELKTVQVIDGEDLPVSKPCIYAGDEGYNVEWSTELTVKDAFNEYIKAWFMIHVLMKELNLSRTRDFMFNMSVGYDLKGIKSKKINDYIDGMIDASSLSVWKECMEVLLKNLYRFRNFNAEDVDNISSNICSSITISTLHGCPPDEIEKIATYLMQEKHLNTFIKMNPMLLGEEFVRNTLNHMGYEYINLNPHHFKNDLQFNDAIKMIRSLKDIAENLNLKVGVKLTNTLPAKIMNHELPGEEMYMSGRPLFPLAINLAYKLAEKFNGDLIISYSGGADYFNIMDILSTGISPVTFATTLLKPGGYERIYQLASTIDTSIDIIKQNKNLNHLKDLAESAVDDINYRKKPMPVKNKKLRSKLPIFDCASAPCSNGCPIHQQISEYIYLVGEKRYDEAFAVIANDNTSPAITSVICNHNCQNKCTRQYYDESVYIRNMKNIAVMNAEDKFIEELKEPPLKTDKKAVVIGAGPAGLAAAVYLRRNGMDVTVLEKRDKPYGTVQYLIPGFRINQDMIDKDFNMAKKYGVNFKFNINEEFNINELKAEYDYIILALGTWNPIDIKLSENSEKPLSAIKLLEDFKCDSSSLKLGGNVCVVGGGNVAADAARAAKKVKGVKNVSILYRRTKDLMPADSEEIDLLLAENIKIMELLSPKEFIPGKLICTKMILGEKDESGRSRPMESDQTVYIDADTLILAVGNTVDNTQLIKNNIELNSNGYPKVDSNYQTSIKNVYTAGDMKSGPSTIVNAIADAKIIANNILKKENIKPDFMKFHSSIDSKTLYLRKGLLSKHSITESESDRCLSCDTVCELCVDVCPNRANMLIRVNNKNMRGHQILHLDGMCNECGNCGMFCPHDGDPYKDKLTLFWSEEDLNNSINKGFFMKDSLKGLFIVRLDDRNAVEYRLGEKEKIPFEFEEIIKSCFNHYNYIL